LRRIIAMMNNCKLDYRSFPGKRRFSWVTDRCQRKVWLWMAVLATLGTVLAHESANAECDFVRYGWTQRMGGGAKCVVTGPTNEIFLAGIFLGTVDFDPSEGVDERESVTHFESDIFVTRVRADGDYSWTYTAGGDEADGANGVVIDHDGNVYVTGFFQETIDFDPGPGIDEHAAPYFYNTFITSLGPDGAYFWTRSFQGSGLSGGADIALDSLGDLVITGGFDQTVDFDPGTGVDERSSIGSRDIYVTKLNADGWHVWTVTFGGGGFDSARNVATDSTGNIFVTGEFRHTADFDPGPGVDLHTTQNRPVDKDVFVTKLGPDGSYRWTHTWPVQGGDQLGDHAIGPDGSVVITGAFREPVDFDPTDGVDLRTATPDEDGEPSRDLFLTKINGDGSYAWTYTAEETGSEVANAVAIDKTGDVLVLGSVRRGTVDFDPGPGEVLHSPIDNFSAFFLRLRDDGSFVSVDTMDYAHGFSRGAITTDQQDNNVVLARYIVGGPVDLDPVCGLDFREPSEPGLPTLHITKLLCSSLPGDYDFDGDVDLCDVSQLQNCFTAKAARSCDPGCDAFDLTGLGGITLSDFSALVPSLTGP